MRMTDSRSVLIDICQWSTLLIDLLLHVTNYTLSKKVVHFVRQRSPWFLTQCVVLRGGLSSPGSPTFL